MTVLPGPPYPGGYEHYKGGIYVVHKIITDETSNRFSGRLTDGRIMVLYESLETKEWHVRQITDFLSLVHADGSLSWEHHMSWENDACEKCRPRFRKISTP
jgi:hypothetical protein